MKNVAITSNMNSTIDNLKFQRECLMDAAKSLDAAISALQGIGISSAIQVADKSIYATTVDLLASQGVMTTKAIIEELHRRGVKSKDNVIRVTLAKNYLKDNSKIARAGRGRWKLAG